MILEDLLKSQELISASKSLEKDGAWDIGIYGSIVRGKKNFGDVDFVIFLKEPSSVDKKLSISKKLRDKIKDAVKNADVEVISVVDFLDETFLARQGIIGECYLILHKKYLSEMLGFRTFVLFMFSLKGLSASKKTMFRYAISGRRGQKGILKDLKGEYIGAGVVKIPVAFSEKFRTFLESNKIEYRTETAIFYNFK